MTKLQVAAIASAIAMSTSPLTVLASDATAVLWITRLWAVAATITFLICFITMLRTPSHVGQLAILRHENGKIKSRGYVTSNAMSDESIKVGIWTHYSEDGKREKHGCYVDDQMHGTWSFYLADGTKKRGSMLHGQMDGLWTYYGKAGNLTKSESYKNGTLINTIP